MLFKDILDARKGMDEEHKNIDKRLEILIFILLYSLCFILILPISKSIIASLDMTKLMFGSGIIEALSAYVICIPHFILFMVEVFSKKNRLSKLCILVATLFLLSKYSMDICFYLA